MTKSYPNVVQSWGITGMLVLAMLLFTPMIMVLNPLIGEEGTMLVYYLCAVGIPLWIAQAIRMKEASREDFSFRISNPKLIPLVAITGMALLFGVIMPLNSLIPVPDFLVEAFRSLTRETGFLTFALMVIAAPLLEELIFRGIILNGLLYKYSPVKSILLSSFLFGFVHLNPWQFVTGFILGLFMGWIYYRSRSVSLTVAIHAAVNLSGFLARHLGDAGSSFETDALDIYGGPLNLVLVMAGSISVAVIGTYWINKEFDRTSAPQIKENLLPKSG